MVVAGDLSFGWTGKGTYRLEVNGLFNGLKVRLPTVAVGNLNLIDVDGFPGATFVLLTTTNITTRLNLWTPIQTNQFDPYGTFAYMNITPRM